MIPSGFGQAWGCCFTSKTVLHHHTSFFRKIDFLVKKMHFYAKAGRGRKSHFLTKKLIFSNFFILSGDGSYRVWTGLGVLFRPQNTFLIPLVVFEKNRFFAQKSAFLPSSRYGVKNRFFWSKNLFFQGSSAANF
mgnify:CR=1 FL=1